MKAAIALLVVLAVFTPAGGQTYTIRTVAGGGLPEGITGGGWRGHCLFRFGRL